MAEESPNDDSKAVKGYSGVLPTAPFDEGFLRETFKVIVSIKAFADLDWQSTYAEALLNNQIEKSDVITATQLTSANLPLAKWRARELQEGVSQGKSQSILFRDQLMDIIELARHCSAERRHKEAQLLLEFSLECLEAHMISGYGNLNRVTQKSLVLVLLSQTCEALNDLSSAEKFQMFLIKLIDDCDETEIGRQIRRSLQRHLRGRVLRLIDLLDRQNKIEDSKRWKSELLKIPESGF